MPDQPDDRRPDDPTPAAPRAAPGASSPGTPDQVGEAPAGEPGSRRDSAAEPVRPPTPLTQQLGRIALLVLVALFAIFAVANSQRVDFSWIFGATRARTGPTGQVSGGVPLIVLLLASFVIGAALGALLEWQFLRGRRARRDGKGR